MIWVILAPFIALALRDPVLLSFKYSHNTLSNSYQYAALTIAFAVPTLLFFRLSDGLSRFFSTDDIWSVLAATCAIIAGSSVTLFVINRLEGIPRSTPVIYGLVLAGGLLGGRALARMARTERWFDTEAKEATPHVRRVIVVGVDSFASIVIKLTDFQQPRTTQVVAALDRRERMTGRTVNGVQIVGRPTDLEAVIEEYRVHGVEIDEVWLSDNAAPREDAARLELQCRALGVKASTISRALNLATRQAPAFCEPRAETKTVIPHAGYFRVKRILDIAIALALLLVFVPVALVIAGLTYLDVGGPVIFWQRRIGQGGRDFLVLKFRTYLAPYTKKGHSVASSARLSRIGKAIRATRLDEIPQLVNVLRGDMSLIGPRPLLPVDQPEDPSLRLLVRPGVSGWAQVNGGNQVTPEEKDALDVWYIYHASPALDIKIVSRTLLMVFRGEDRSNSAIETAKNWCEKTRRIDHRLFGETAAGKISQSVLKTASSSLISS
ncbi:MAG: sugar transferase [Alphaproteobacteria bacterium]|nr:sugar transferase [Alphaproteobacteria bacterium]